MPLTEFDEDEDDDFFVGGGDWWVIPHWSSLDYCHVTVISEEDKHGRVFVRGTRDRGWNPDGAQIKTRVPVKKLTRINSDLVPFKDLYDDPCIPERR